jgi:hypothetical protein
MIENDPWAKLDKPPIKKESDFADRIDQLFVNKDQSVLDEEFRNKCKHRRSQNLPENIIVNSAIQLKKTIKDTPKQKKNGWDFSETLEEKEYKNLYSNYPEPYDTGWEKFKNTEKNDDIEWNVGWKFHINVSPDNCLMVSSWLKDNNYCHKLLHGGEIEDGKIFTVYIGSYELSKKLAKEVSQGVGKFISKPVDITEIEFEEGIIGRFDYGYNHGKAYGTCGFSLNPDYKSLPRREQELKSYRELKSKFGNYFHE